MPGTGKRGARGSKPRKKEPSPSPALPASPVPPPPPPVETEILVREKESGAKPALKVPSPVTNCLRCKRNDILVIVALDGKMVGLCPDHFKLDVMTYLP